MGVNKVLTSPEQSSSSSGYNYDYSSVAEPAHPITDQQGETIHLKITGHYSHAFSVYLKITVHSYVACIYITCCC